MTEKAQNKNLNKAKTGKTDNPGHSRPITTGQINVIKSRQIGWSV